MEQYPLTSRSNKTVGSTFKDNGNVKKSVYLVRCWAGVRRSWNGARTRHSLLMAARGDLSAPHDPEITQMYLSRVIKQTQPVAFQV